jgi:hypothetical protein
VNSAAVRGAMAGLPYSLATTADPNLTVAGMAISVVDASLMAHMGGRIEQNREQLARLTEDRVDRLEERGRLDDQILESPEFHSLVFQAALAAAGETETEKVDLYAAILAGAASTERPSELNVRAVLSTLTSLTADELQLARQFYEDFDRGQNAIIDGLATPTWGPDTGLYLKRLEIANLIVPEYVRGNPFEGTPGTYFVTDTFHRLMALVRESE